MQISGPLPAREITWLIMLKTKTPKCMYSCMGSGQTSEVQVAASSGYNNFILTSNSEELITKITKKK